MCNSTKTGVVQFSSRYLERQLIAKENISGSEINTSINARDVGLTLDRCLTISTYVSNLCKFAAYALKPIGTIWSYLAQSSTEKLIHAFVSPEWDCL